MFVYASKFFRLLLIGFLIFIFFSSWEADELSKDPSNIWFYNSHKVQFLAQVIEQPDQRINHTKLTVAVSSVQQQNVSGKVLVSTSLYPVYRYGDELLISCKLRLPEKFDDFSYDRYLAKSGIYSICSYPNIKIISRNNGDYLLTKVFSIKNEFQQLINNNLPEPQASVLSAMMLGQRRGIPEELSEKFNTTGTTHLLAISGLHITIFFTILMQLFSAVYLSRKTSFYVVSIFLIFYLTLIGFPASAVRAGIMGFLLMLAMYLGRLNKSTNSILLAASVMVFINPKILLDDISFQLSFSATLGIIHFSPFFQDVFKKVSNFLGLRDVLVMSFSAYLATLPLVIFYFSRISLVGIIANLLVVPIVAYVIIFGFLALILSLIFPVLSFYFFLPVFLILTYMIKIINLFYLVPYASLEI